MLCKKLISTLLLCISFHTTFSNNTFSVYPSNSYETCTFFGPGSEFTDKYKVTSIGQMILENTHVEILPNNNDWHNNITTIYQDPDVKGRFDHIPTLLIPVAWIGENIADFSDWIGSFFEDDDPKPTTSNTSPSNNKLQSTPECQSNTITLASEEEIKIQQYDAMQKFIRDHQPALEAYRDELCDYLTEIDNTPYRDAYNRGARRLEACWMNKSNQKFSTHTYTISQEITPFMRKHSLNVEAYEVCHGNFIQQQLHMEIIEILTASSEIDRIFSAYNESPLFSDLVAEGVDLARELNTQGDVIQGFRIADYCGWLNEAEYPRLANIVKQAAGFVVGTAEGGINIVKNTYHMVRHPYETGKGLVYVLGHASMFLFHGAQEVGPFAFHLSFHGTPSGYELHPQFAQDLNAIKDFYNQTMQELAQLPPEERNRKVMAFVTELYFTGRFMGQVAKIKRAATANIIKPGATSLANKLQLYKYKAITQTYTRITSTIANAQDIVKTTAKNWFKPPAGSWELVLDEAGNWKWVYDIDPSSLESIATECSSLVPLEKAPSILNRTSMTEIIQSTIQETASELLPGATQQAIEILNQTSPALPTNTSTQNGPHVPVNSNLGGNIPNPPMDIIQAMQPLTSADHAEIAKYTCLATHNGHPVIPPFEHTWIAQTARKGKKLAGFHQDRMGFYKQLGLIRNVQMKAEYFYTAEVYFNGEWITRSFFPENWNIGELMRCYYDVIKNPSEVLSDRGRTLYKHMRQSGIEISVVIEDASGIGISFFPNLVKP